MEPTRTPAFAAPHACANCGGPFTPVVAGQTLCDKCQGLTHPEPTSPLQQAEVAGYRLVHELGAGRFAHSWLAEDPQGRAFVLKLLRRYAPDPNAVQRYLAEAQRLAGAPELAHPNIARPANGGVHLVQALFLVYESGGDQTLADELRQRGRVLPGRALELCAQVCEGLSVLHGLGVLHLDLKPANVGLTRLEDGSEQAVVLDCVTPHLLGLIGVRDGATLPISSAAYMSPEEAKGTAPDARSDLYSVGVLLFHLVSGRLPFAGGSADELLQAHRHSRPLRLRDVGRRVHPELEELVARLLAKDPAHRPQTGDEAAVLMRALAPVAEAAPPKEGEEDFEDPLPLLPVPVDSPPPEMLPPPVDPALERAMMGDFPAAPERAPGVPAWAFVPPRWWPVVACAAAAVLIAALLVARKPAPEGPRVSAPPVVQAVPVPLPVAAAPAATPAPAPAVAPTSPPAPEPEPLAHKPAPSAWTRSFDRAQHALWTNEPRFAQIILKDLLKKSKLSRHDKARASKMMGDAEARLGNKTKAASWYRKSFSLYEDPEERAKVGRLLQR